MWSKAVSWWSAHVSPRLTGLRPSAAALSPAAAAAAAGTEATSHAKSSAVKRKASSELASATASKARITPPEEEMDDTSMPATRPMFPLLCRAELQSILQFLPLGSLCLFSATSREMRMEVQQPVVWKRWVDHDPSEEWFADGIHTQIRVDQDCYGNRWTASSIARWFIPVHIIAGGTPFEECLKKTRQFARVVSFTGLLRPRSGVRDWTRDQVWQLLDSIAPTLTGEIELGRSHWHPGQSGWLASDVLARIFSSKVSSVTFEVDESSPPIAKDCIPIDSSVRDVSLGGWWKASPEQLLPLERCTGLRSLELQAHDEKPPAWLMDLPARWQLRDRLEELDISHMDLREWPAGSFEQMLRQLPRLRQLNSYAGPCDAFFQPLINLAEAGQLSQLRDVSFGWDGAEAMTKPDDPALIRRLVDALPDVTIHLDINGDGDEEYYAKKEYAGDTRILVNERSSDEEDEEDEE